MYINYASLMVLSSVTMSGLLLWIVLSGVTIIIIIIIIDRLRLCPVLLSSHSRALNQVSAMGFASGSIEMSVTSREHGKMT
jgi:hypothetical protein